MNWGSPKPRKSLKKITLQLRARYFEVFWEKGDPQSSCGESPHELGGSPERGRLIHMEGFQIQLAVALTEILQYRSFGFGSYVIYHPWP